MHKKLPFLPLPIFIGVLVIVSWTEASHAQVCTPGETIVRDVAKNDARTGDGPLFSDGEPLVRQITFTATSGYMITGYEFIQEGAWGKTSKRVDEFAAGTQLITASNVESAKRELTDYIGGKVSILDKVKIDARQRLEQLSSQYLSLAKQASTSNATLQLTLEAIPRSQKRTSAIWGFLRVKLRCVGFTNQDDLRLSLRREVDQILAKGIIPTQSETPVPQQNIRYAAFAVSNSAGEYGIAWGYQTQSEAENSALQACTKQGFSDCRIATWYKGNTYGAIAKADDGSGTGWALGNSRGEAEQMALRSCQKFARNPDKCKVVFSRSASGAEAQG